MCGVRFDNGGEGENPNPSGQRAIRPFPLPLPRYTISCGQGCTGTPIGNFCSPALALSRLGGPTAAGRKPQERHRVWSAVFPDSD